MAKGKQVTALTSTGIPVGKQGKGSGNGKKGAKQEIENDANASEDEPHLLQIQLLRKRRR
eukprot:1888308-Karenia_brevis.AAC.1